MDQMLERLASKSFYCFLDEYNGYNHIVINLKDQEKTTFTCPFGTYAIGECLLVSVMHQQLFKDARVFFFTMLKE
jgi:hypothetical protein